MCFGTIQDLSQLGLRLEQGMRLTIYMDSCEREDLEFDGVAQYDNNAGMWLIEYDPATLRYTPCRDRTRLPFLCWACRRPATYTGRGRGEVCSICGESLDAPWSSPR